MERGSRFGRIRETDREADDQEHLESEINRRESLEKRDEQDSNLEKRISDVVIRARVRSVIDSVENRENESKREVDEEIETVLQEVDKRLITTEERDKILNSYHAELAAKEELVSEIDTIEPTTEVREEPLYLDTSESFQDALENHPELRFRKKFSEEDQDVQEFYESEKNEQPPSLVR